MAQSWHARIRCLLLWKLETFAEETQCKGRSGRDTDFAAHAVRAFVGAACSLHRSAAVLVVSLSEAFDSAVPKMLMAGRMEPASVRCNLIIKIGLDEDIVVVAIAYIAGGDEFERADVP